MTSAEPGHEAASSGRLVEVFASASIPEGLLAKGLLESAGIPVVEKGMAEGPYRMAPIYLWVPVELEVQARTLLDAARSGQGVAEPGDVGTAEGEPAPG